MFRLLLSSILVLTSSIVNAQVEYENCFGEPWDGFNEFSGDYSKFDDSTLWSGSFSLFNVWDQEWDDYHTARNASEGGGFIGAGENMGDATTDHQICFSLQPFKTTNTNNGEICTNEGPLEWTTSTTYYRMMIDRTQATTRYCQIAIVTSDVASADRPLQQAVGNTLVVTLDANGNNTGQHPDENGSTDDKYPGQGAGGGGGGGQQNRATPVPTMPMYLLMGLSGLLALFGFYRVRASK